MRKKLIAANWKMHKTPDEAVAFVREFTALIPRHDRDDNRAAIHQPLSDTRCGSR
jgi:triosephosphate isomerase